MPLVRVEKISNALVRFSLIAYKTRLRCPHQDFLHSGSPVYGVHFENALNDKTQEK